MNREQAAAGPRCPVCAHDGASPLLDLPGQAIYQHPVVVEAVVPEPHKVDLTWVSCDQCSHGWQPTFDPGLLERVYRNFYYTPAPDGIAVTFREEFLAVLHEFGIAGPREVIVEIGASSGDLLAEVRDRMRASRAWAFEPNSENARVARARGLEVREEFFSQRASLDQVGPANLVYARHVIEHVFDFGDFFGALRLVSALSTDLVLETPSLDFHAEHGSLDPFHVEHIHVFSQRSLARLATVHGWGLQRAKVTSHGNLIAWFRRGVSQSQEPVAPAADLQQNVASSRAELVRILATRWLVFWGAGSSGITLVNEIGREPDVWTDGNPNKIGRRFIGLQGEVVAPEMALAAAKRPHERSAAIVITSTFVEEILPRVRALGWDGDVFDSKGVRL
jgi:Methyltransferase domain